MGLLLFILMFVRMLRLEILNQEDCWILALPKTSWDGVFSLPKVGFAGK